MEEKTVFLEYRLSDGVVEKIYESEQLSKEGYRTAKTTGFQLGDEFKNFIVVNETDKDGNLTSCTYIKEPASAEYLREENLKLREQAQILAQTNAQLNLENADLKQQMQTLSQTVAQMQIGGVN